MIANAVVGRVYYTIGLNMDCRPCVATVTLHQLLGAEEIAGGRYDCVTRSGGLLVMGHTRDLYASKCEVKKAIEAERLKKAVLK